MSTEEVKPITVKKFPLILRKKIIKPQSKGKLVNSLKNSIQEDIIYESKPGDFTSGEARSMTIVNRMNILTQSSTTVAKCRSHSGELFEKTSEEVTKLIGQNNYDVLFTSLCSLFSQELKIRSINSLLTIPKKTNSVSCQTNTNADRTISNSTILKNSLLKKVIETSAQTNETSLEDFKRIRPKRRIKRQQLSPYVVKDIPEPRQPKKLVISPENFENFEMILIKEEGLSKESPIIENTLPELGTVFDEDSNNSVGRFSSLSVRTVPDLMTNPLNILVDKHTRNIEIEQSNIQNLDSSTDSCMSYDKLTSGSKELLCNVPPEQRVKLLLRQGLNDWKYCLTQDNNGHLPIHVAVLTNDVDLLRRQCLVLKMRDTSVDVPVDGLTPLKMSLFQTNTQMTALLLDFGADLLETDDDDRNSFHIAAELSTDHLQILLNYCQQNPRKILHENEELWNPSFENKSDEELSKILLRDINKTYDSQGYTPLMLASKLGKYNNVMALVESCKETINIKMPSSGNTALYLAVGAACMDSAERGNKAKIVDHFSKTVEILVENGADPSIDNFAGSSVNDLLTEFNIGELSMLIANKLTSIRYFDGQLPSGVKSSDFMLFKDKEGDVNIKEVKDIPNRKYPPIILENVAYKPPPVKADNSKPSISTLPAQLPKQPVIVGNLGKIIKQENVNVSQSYTPIIKNFQLNKPIMIKSKITSNNKRKLDIVIETSKIKKPNVPFAK